MDKQVATVAETNVVEIAPDNPSRLIELAIDKGANIDQLEKLMALQERWDANQARKAYANAFTQFQSTVPTLKKTKKVKFNQTEYSYTPLGDIAEQIRPTLLGCGLSYRFEINDKESVISVVCIVSHIDGHSERTTMDAAPDSSGSKNGIQQRGSTITYLQRYTLIAALGLTTADEDIDGRMLRSDGDYINDTQLADLESLLGEVTANRQKFLEHFKIQELGDLKASQYRMAVQMLERKRKQ